jgi:hypothetical protein
MFLRSLLVHLWDCSPRKILHALVHRAGKRTKPGSPDASFLLSDEYQYLMMKYVPFGGHYGLHEAQTYTRSYIFRHRECLDRLGVFRWRGMQKHLRTILTYVAAPGNLVVDFGGAGCPLGFNSVIVDRLKLDALGRQVPYSSFNQIGRPVDVVFACHVLEHIPNLDQVLGELKNALAPEGVLIAFVPAFTNEGWRACTHRNRLFGDHLWTFGLSETRSFPEDMPNYLNIDEVLGKYFEVEKANYCGDDSIYCLCRKRVESLAQK